MLQASVTSKGHKARQAHDSVGCCSPANRAVCIARSTAPHAHDAARTGGRVPQRVVAAVVPELELEGLAAQRLANHLQSGQAAAERQVSSRRRRLEGRTLQDVPGRAAEGAPTPLTTAAWQHRSPRPPSPPTWWPMQMPKAGFLPRIFLALSTA